MFTAVDDSLLMVSFKIRALYIDKGTVQDIWKYRTAYAQYGRETFRALAVNKTSFPTSQCNKALPNNNCISRRNHVVHISGLLAPLMITWHSRVPRRLILCVACLSIVLCGLERAPQFWLQKPHWVTKSTSALLYLTCLLYAATHGAVLLLPESDPQDVERHGSEADGIFFHGRRHQ